MRLASFFLFYSSMDPGKNKKKLLHLNILKDWFQGKICHFFRQSLAVMLIGPQHLIKNSDFLDLSEYKGMMSLLGWKNIYKTHYHTHNCFLLTVWVQLHIIFVFPQWKQPVINPTCEKSYNKQKNNVLLLITICCERLISQEWAKTHSRFFF